MKQRVYRYGGFCHNDECRNASTWSDKAELAEKCNLCRGPLEPRPPKQSRKESPRNDV